MAGDRSGVLATVNPSDHLERYANGERIADIAASLGVVPYSIIRQFLRDCPDDWRDVQAASSLQAYLEAVQALDGLEPELGPVACNLAQARVKTRQWELERLLKRLYGPSQEITGRDGGPIVVEIVKFSGRTLEGARVDKSSADVTDGALSVLCQLERPAPKLPSK